MGQILSEAEYNRLPQAKKKEYKYKTAIGNKFFSSDVLYYKTLKDRKKIEKDFGKSGVPVGKSWSEKEFASSKRGWM